MLTSFACTRSWSRKWNDHTLGNRNPTILHSQSTVITLPYASDDNTLKQIVSPVVFTLCCSLFVHSAAVKQLTEHIH